MVVQTRYATAFIIALTVTILLLIGMPVLLRFTSPPKKESTGEAIKLLSAMRIKPPPPKKKEIRKKDKPPPKVHPKLKQIMPKLDDMSLLDVPFQFDLGLQGDQDMGLSLGVKIWDEAQVDAKPVALFRVKPVYPQSAMSKNINGRVSIKLLVDRDGTVKTVEVLNAEPEGMFEDATLNAVSQWRFQPAKVQGNPVACWVKTSINYELEL
jgi:protein TonB